MEEIYDNDEYRVISLQLRGRTMETSLLKDFMFIRYLIPSEEHFGFDAHKPILSNERLYSIWVT